MASLTIGGKYKSMFTGKVYRVKIVKEQMVVLESVDGSSQVLTNKENLHLFYKTVFQKEDEQFNLGGGLPFTGEEPPKNNLIIEEEPH